MNDATSILGTGLHCALGDDLDTAAAALLAGHQPLVTLELDALHSPLRLPYLPIVGVELPPRERLYHLLDSAVAAALDTADLSPAARARTGIFLASSSMDISVSEARYRHALTNEASANPLPLAGYGNLAARLAARHGLKGPTYTFNTACSSAANALLYAQRLIGAGTLDHALVIGSEVHNGLSCYGFHSLMLYAEKTTRPFDLHRQGLVLGEAVAAAVLGRDSDHGPLDGLRLRGGATACDTTSTTYTTPEHIAATVHAALADAGATHDAVRGIKAHGTGTPSNDQAEALGLRRVFGRTLPPLTSIKPQLGHTLGACGLIETVLFMRTLADRRMPATVGFNTPDPELGAQPLTTPAPAPHGLYLLNYFGFGGNNSVLVVERAA
ncbi:beta-ketoacyl synthase N-terminal-like domain-containing protein [Acidihalobacter ferrooxydans]|uniref:Ketosynthase family 3 (KS3) domain-containing protein n=1 Tax=Acidihalobacter ferrooxydans TaxID=1765967 RepID=A0A1P8UDW0_9GAMM|nr:beta-ketoacyl synthase N-terminal-like domain-containing protein [Acidihalobacter ferrooxydans]APZ42051.1 hypothetical protein BW247_02185 [Acidihalobacter ferrooxydans]